MKRTSTKVLLIVAAFALFLVPVAAIAVGPTFTDVPPTDWAYDDVEWLAANMLTNGCGDGTTFCPDDGVTRREMAAFTHRLAASRVVDAGKLDGFSVESIVPRAVGTTYYRASGQPDDYVATVTINAPAPGVIIAHASGDSWLGTGEQYCGLEVDQSYPMGGAGYVDHAQHDEADCIASGSLVVAAGVHTVDLYLGGNAETLGGAMWAMWVPFDGTGAVPTAAAALGSVELDAKYQK